MTKPGAVTQHYTHGDLVRAIEAGVSASGKTTTNLSLDDLAPVDEFHIGGRQASIDFLDQLSIAPEHAVLDVGCGIGGASRFTTSRYGAKVTGIDLTLEYVETAKVLSAWLGLSDALSFEQASATELPFSDGRFDRAYMLHVGMNIPNKSALCQSVAGALKAGGLFGIYDVMQTSDGDLTFPVPWATVAETSAVATPAHYRECLDSAGFEIIGERNRYEFALKFFEQLKAKVASAGGPPPLGLHILMGSNAPQKVQNMIENITAGRIAPVEIIARKRG